MTTHGYSLAVVIGYKIRIHLCELFGDQPEFRGAITSLEVGVVGPNRRKYAVAKALALSCTHKYDYPAADILNNSDNYRSWDVKSQHRTVKGAYGGADSLVKFMRSRLAENARNLLFTESPLCQGWP